METDDRWDGFDGSHAIRMAKEYEMNRTEFEKLHPDAFYLDVADINGLQRYLEDRGFLRSSSTGAEKVTIAAKLGDGNMNCTVLVSTLERDFVLKQARPWVEKYPSIPAPWDRALFEARFYQSVSQSTACQSKMPKLLSVDRASRILFLEALRDAKDLSSLYAGEVLTLKEARSLADYLSELHSLKVSAQEMGLNSEMRKLNHEHIFKIPLLSENGIDLDAITPGMSDAAGSLKRDQVYVSKIHRLGELYLADRGSSLLHGDFYPGSWLRAPNGPFVIDPEFGFLGPPEFDLGVFIAHLKMAQQPSELPDGILEMYLEKRSGLDVALIQAFSGAEIMRRLLGVAQLPVHLTLSQKTSLLDQSREMVAQYRQG